MCMCTYTHHYIEREKEDVTHLVIIVAFIFSKAITTSTLYKFSILSVSGKLLLKIPKTLSH